MPRGDSYCCRSTRTNQRTVSLPNQEMRRLGISWQTPPPRGCGCLLGRRWRWCSVSSPTLVQQYQLEGFQWEIYMCILLSNLQRFSPYQKMPQTPGTLHRAAEVRRGWVSFMIYVSKREEDHSCDPALCNFYVTFFHWSFDLKKF